MLPRELAKAYGLQALPRDVKHYSLCDPLFETRSLSEHFFAAEVDIHVVACSQPPTELHFSCVHSCHVLQQENVPGSPPQFQ